MPITITFGKNSNDEEWQRMVATWEGKIVSNLKTDANSKHAIEKLFKYSGR